MSVTASFTVLPWVRCPSSRDVKARLYSSPRSVDRYFDPAHSTRLPIESCMRVSQQACAFVRTFTHPTAHVPREAGLRFCLRSNSSRRDKKPFLGERDMCSTRLITAGKGSSSILISVTMTKDSLTKTRTK
ncbi:uncharacterized protein LOC143188073 [Calliopsis andreniformis]|uniref:uncharacterized protein LOC143188073 n=1 Tax=Calliopsis andreniformis TaxID=337506 RepID=UPI003FCEA5A6